MAKSKFAKTGTGARNRAAARELGNKIYAMPNSRGSSRSEAMKTAWRIVKRGKW